MIVVVAGGADAEAARLIERWAAVDAVLVTPDDLSRVGWSARFPHAGPSFVADGTTRRTSQISGALVRLQAVSPSDLPHLRAADRQYASAEMTAFLSYWLTALECPVVNRPSPSYLVGLAWTNEQWLTIAARLGQSVRGVVVNDDDDEGVRAATDTELRWVTVVGDRAFNGSAEERAATIALARRGDVRLLGAGYDARRTHLAAVTVRPPITVEVADALLGLFGEQHT